MSVLEFVTTQLRDAGLVLREHPELGAVSFEHRAGLGAWTVVVRTREPFAQVAVFSVYNYDIPEDTRHRVMEFITRANFGLFMGCFELDLDTGELRLRTSLDFGGDRLSGPLLARLIEHNVSTFERYLPAINGAVTASRPIPELIALAEDQPVA